LQLYAIFVEGKRLRVVFHIKYPGYFFYEGPFLFSSLRTWPWGFILEELSRPRESHREFQMCPFLGNTRLVIQNLYLNFQ
jgi:hypothetical protein